MINMSNHALSARGIHASHWQLTSSLGHASDNLPKLAAYTQSCLRFAIFIEVTYI
jgi:hypothetical protein